MTVIAAPGAAAADAGPIGHRYEASVKGKGAGSQQAPERESMAAVVVYRAISLWVPALLGSAAFWSLRREIGREPVPIAGETG